MNKEKRGKERKEHSNGRKVKWKYERGRKEAIV